MKNLMRWAWLLVLGWGLSAQRCGNQQLVQHKGPKINGVSFVAPVNPIDSTALTPVTNINATWVCLMPYAFVRRESNQVIHSQKGQWWGENTEGIKGCVVLAHEQGLRVMLKPHLWLRGGQFTGTFDLPTEAKWQVWEQGYGQYIKTYARLADSLNVELLCIGTELENFAKKRPQFWKSLIAEVRGLYRGKLTYAANWDTFEQFPHWASLDYVGIDAYFPLHEAATPSVEELRKAWAKHHEQIESFVTQTPKPILFTEYGYRSINQTAHQPWVADTPAEVNHEAQARAYEALFQRFWPEPWFAGGFVWKWYDPAMLQRAESRWHRMATDYTPQNKPAEQVIKQWYGRKE
jgi:hypothetical protein